MKRDWFHMLENRWISQHANLIFRGIPVPTTCIDQQAKKKQVADLWSSGEQCLQPWPSEQLSLVRWSSITSIPQWGLPPGDSCLPHAAQHHHSVLTLNNSLRWENRYQAILGSKWDAELEKSPWLAKASESMSCSDTQKQAEERKKVHMQEKGQDQC